MKCKKCEPRTYTEYGLLGGGILALLFWNPAPIIAGAFGGVVADSLRRCESCGEEIPESEGVGGFAPPPEIEEPFIENIPEPDGTEWSIDIPDPPGTTSGSEGSEGSGEGGGGE